jgi:peptidoglycan/xylan/chitin deacetylase (PgdA/CDA1 family)
MKVRPFAPVSNLCILTYHHIADPGPAYPHDPDIADATAPQFRWQMETLAKYCSPIGIDELLAALDGAPLPPNPVMVTFDDGYASCHDVALPILRAVGIRATFFISTEHVSERRLFWWERVSLLVAQATRAGTITYPKRMTLSPRDGATRRRLDDAIKDTPNLEVDRFLAEVANALGVEWSPEIEASFADGLIMTWDQIRALSRAGMDVESHSKSHRVLQTLSADELHAELAGSKLELETQLGRPVRAIAYPVGRRLGRGAKWIRDALVDAGYQLGLTNGSGVNRLWPSSLRGLRRLAPFDRYDVRRLSLDRSISNAMFLTQIAVPRFAYIGRHDAD